MSQFCFSLEFLSQNSLWKLSAFREYKSIYSIGYKMECEKSLFNKIGCTSDWDESWVLVASYQTRAECTFCPVLIQLAWLFIFLHASQVCFILASHHSQVNCESSCKSPSCCTLLIKSSHFLTHNPYIIPTSIRGF